MAKPKASKKVAPKRRRAPRRRPWQRQLREDVVAVLEDVIERLPGLDFAASSGPRAERVQELVGDLVEVCNRLEEARCYRCGCSTSEACPEGCSWVALDPPLCSACA